MKFGPSGNSESFIKEGYTSSVQAPKWLKDRGLDIYEYSFGRGIRIGIEHANAIRDEAIKYGIEISVHSPYYVNLSSDSDATIINSLSYVMQSLVALRNLGGKRCVVHPGSPLKQGREEASKRMLEGFNTLSEMVLSSEYSDVIICPETMGKVNQMGTLDEVLKICQISDIYIPCIDFGHLNSRGFGIFNNSEDYRKVFDSIFNAIGEDRGRRIHMHFSHIEYGKSGEIRHLNSDDNKFGPFFEHLAPILHEYKIDGWLLSESAGAQAEDAKLMKDTYNLFTT